MIFVTPTTRMKNTTLARSKLKAFDNDLTYHSPDPADPAVTRRVITIMVAEEY
jgi:hypothetical protein